MKLCHFDEYTPIHLIRPISDNIDFENKGGGISIFVRNNLSFKHRDDRSIMLLYMEGLFIEMQFGSKKYLIGGIIVFLTLVLIFLLINLMKLLSN